VLGLALFPGRPPPSVNKLDNSVEVCRMMQDQDLVQFSQNVPVSDFVYAVNISTTHKYMYVETPKVGCTTVKSILIRAEFDRDFEFSDDEHVHRRNLSPLLNPRQVGKFADFIKGDIFKFCFVRNPYTRLLSNYLDKIANPVARREKIALRIASQLDIESDTRPISFPEFVQAVVEQPIELMDSHWRVQYYQTFQGTLRYDFIGRFENFREDLVLVCEKIGIDFDKWYRIEAVHATNAAMRLDQFYDQHLRDLVYSKYRVDFEHFGYLP
jgi:Sulfotransferase family